jgi:hypothetical protein
MGECEIAREMISKHDRKLLPPEREAGLLNGIYQIYKDPPAALTADPCGTARAEGVLAGTLSAVRNNGEAYSSAVYRFLDQAAPGLGALLGNATIESNGHIEFR